MPQYPFIQSMAVAAVLAFAGFVAVIPVGARVSARAGRLVLRASAIGLLVAIGACFAWGASSGDLARFTARMGIDAWIQIGAFFLIILSTAYRFVGRYLDDRAQAEAGDACAPAGGGADDA